jgi:uncharacterized membrane protein YgcG
VWPQSSGNPLHVYVQISPCVILAVVSVLLVRTLRYAERRHRRVQRSSTSTSVQSSRRVEHARTTAMLVAVALCFVAAELPQGVLAFWSGLDPSVFRRFYVPLGDLWDMLALVNSAVNFVLYCTMSRNFRNTFVDVFRFDACGSSGGGASGQAASGEGDAGAKGRETRRLQQQQQLLPCRTVAASDAAANPVSLRQSLRHVSCDVTDAASAM